MLGRTENRTGRADDAARGAPLVVGVSWQRRQRHWHPSSMQQMNLQHCWKKMRQPKKKYKNIVVVWYKTEYHYVVVVVVVVVVAIERKV